MRSFLLLSAALLLVATLSPAQSSSASEQGVANSKNAPGFDIDNIDKSIDPCVDFYQYACGNWLKRAEIPADEPEWVSFLEVNERNQHILRGILEKAAAGSRERDPIEQKIGDYYGSCMDEKTVDARGLEPLKPELDRIAAVEDKTRLIDAVARVHLLGPNPLFEFGSAPDMHNSDMVVADLDQGGLTLPDRNYYIKDDPKMVEMRKKLSDYIVALFRLSGQSPQQAADSAKAVIRIETELAKASMDRTLRRDPKTRDHKMSREAAIALAPDFYLSRYFSNMNSPAFAELNVSNPDFFKEVNGVVESEPLDALKIYVQWHLLSSASPWLSKPFVDANFNFEQALTGQSEIQPRWKRCVDSTDKELGEALGQKYVEQVFPPESKARMLKMVDELEKALDRDVSQVSWMTEETKKQAKIKLQAIRNKIGYPDVWRDYSKLEIRRGDLMGNFLRANEFEAHRDVNKISKPLDRREWGMTPPTVNAYYSGSNNEIVFPAGILQPPFFDKTMDDDVNFGAAGIVIGHELTHGFDDEGRKYDPQGNLRDWWTAQDGAEFEKRAACISDEYSNFVAVDDLKLNGKLTLGENTADNGGARIALMALENLIAEDKTGKAAEKIAGYTPEQRFFLAFARIWCEKRRPEFSRMLVNVDPHSPGRFRTNGVLENMPEFKKAWGCHAGQPMVSPNMCRVW